MWPTASLSLRKPRSDRGHQGIEVEVLDPRRHFLPSRVRLEDPVVRKYEDDHESICLPAVGKWHRANYALN